MFPNKTALFISFAIVLLAIAMGYVLGVRAGSEHVSLPPPPPIVDENPPITIPEIPNPPEEGAPVACTMEAKMCPDGSYVGRVGPRCEFAPCPEASSPESEVSSVTIEVGLNETINVPGTLFSVNPTEVLEDSRCPVDAQCVWEGQVRVRAHLISHRMGQEEVFSIGTSHKPREGIRLVTLTAVSPTPTVGKTINPSEYRFTFVVEK